MIRFDFKTYVEPFLNEEKYQKYMSQKKEILEKFNQQESIGWTKKITDRKIKSILECRDEIKKHCNCLVVIGIGGSFLGSYAFSKMFDHYFFKNSFEVIYAGTTLSSQYLEELQEYLMNKNFAINVISKSGNTMETEITYQVLKSLLKRKYSEEEVKKRIIITTNMDSGPLREEAEKEGYTSFGIPRDIGGRYSFMTPAHLFPLSFHFDIEKIISGYYEGRKLMDQAYEYAVVRRVLFDQKKQIENFCVYEENMTFFTEWLKQLFGETEGKKGVGIFPVSTVHTRDLHSLGQFIQEGNKIVFETFIKVQESPYEIPYGKKSLHDWNNQVEDAVMKAHFKGNVPCLQIQLKERNEKTISSLIYFFQLAAAFSGFLFGVDPFNQPGVEVYKEEMKNNHK